MASKSSLLLVFTLRSLCLLIFFATTARAQLANNNDVNPQANQPFVPLDITCADDKCSEIISYAMGAINYQAPERFLLSFRQKARIDVIGKHGKLNKEYWYVSIDGKRGFVPRQLVKEVNPRLKAKVIVLTEYAELVDGEIRVNQSKLALLRKPPPPSPSTEPQPDPSLKTDDPIKTDPVKDAPGSDGNILASEPLPVVVEGTTIYPESHAEDRKPKDDDDGIVEFENEEDDDDEEDYDEDDEGEEVEIGSDEQSHPKISDQIPKVVEQANEELKIPPPVHTNENVSEHLSATKDVPGVDSKKSENDSPMENISNDELKVNHTDSTKIENNDISASEKTIKENILSNIPERRNLNQNTPVIAEKIENVKNIDNNNTITSDLNKNENPSISNDKNDLPIPEIATAESAKENLKNVDIPNIENVVKAQPETGHSEQHLFNKTSEIDNTEPITKSDSATNEPPTSETTTITDEKNVNVSSPDGENIIIQPEIAPITENIDIVKTSDEISNDNSDPALDSDSIKNETIQNDMDITNVSQSDDLQYKENETVLSFESTTYKSPPKIELNEMNILNMMTPSKAQQPDETLKISNVDVNPMVIENSTDQITQNDEKIHSESDMLNEIPNDQPESETKHDFSSPNPIEAPVTLTPDHQYILTNNDNNANSFTENIIIDPITEPPSEITSDSTTSTQDINPETITSDIEQESFWSNIYNSLDSVYSNAMETINGINWSFSVKDSSMDDIVPESSKILGDDNQIFGRIFADKRELPSDTKSLWDLNELSTDFIFWIVISAVTVLTFTLGYYYIENKRQDKKLLGMINSLQKELMCSSKEAIILKEELSVTKEKLIGIEDSSFGSDEMVNCLKKELAESQQTISEMQEKLIAAEEELVNSAEAALELKTIFEEQMSYRESGNESLAFTVSNLQTQLDDQQTTMNLIKNQLAAKIEENSLLLISVNELRQQKLFLDNEIQQLKSVSEENDNKNAQIKELTYNMEKALQQAEDQRQSDLKEVHLQLKKLKNELNESNVVLKARNEKIASLHESLKLLKIDEKNLDKVLDVSDTKASLEKSISERNLLNEALEHERQCVTELTEKVESQHKNLIDMKECLNDAEQKALQAVSRLEVLTNYFNKKEAELLKELNTKETQWNMREGETVTTVEKMKHLQDEIQQHKDTTESLKRELAEQEAAWKAKVATLERRSHEQWLARRAAERSAEASSKEAQTLRQRLAAPSPDKRVVSPVNNAEVGPETNILPPLLGIGGMLPPPMGFLPPPLGAPMIFPPPLPPHRPAPLGRLSSPPPVRQNRYSPDSRYGPDRPYSPDARRATPQHRGRSPYSPQNSHRRDSYNSRYEDDRYYDSDDDRRPRHYDETETDLSPPPSPGRRRSVPRNHKGLSSGSGQSSESDRVSKRSGKY